MQAYRKYVEEPTTKPTQLAEERQLGVGSFPDAEG
ncbi:hypothetical protein SAMN04489760_10710 [Syntrophus gentianae]|uniref:Uncharacterized protein n=1 Tax=Syntrophus gentianae TaxID=43775 RepID=A0A1H7WLB0_9BACT|nr:hypothetical protein SAMN04489760_10710 [Syntrophus gentianae]